MGIAAIERWENYVKALWSDWRPFDVQWAFYSGLFAHEKEAQTQTAAWIPKPEQIASSNLGQFMRERGFDEYGELHRWSAEKRAEFWSQVISRLGIIFSRMPEKILDLSGGVKDPHWLPGAELNITDSCFNAPPDKYAIVWAQEGDPSIHTLTYAQLEERVNRVANGLKENGFRPGDAVALYMPMTPECIAAYLGIVRFGGRVISVADSFSSDELAKRLEIGSAKGIITSEGYFRSGKAMDLYGKVIAAGAPRAVVIPEPRLEERHPLRDGDLLWEGLLSSKTGFDSFQAGPEHITNILFSSGTTGAPKAIPWTQLTPIKCGMDGHFHQDIHPQDRVCWPTNIGWMMGPWLIYASLLNRAGLALYVGVPTGKGFSDFVRDSGVTVLGVIPSLVRAWKTADTPPAHEWDHVRVLSSTGEASNREDYLWLMSRTAYRAPVIEYMGGTEIGGGYLTGTVVQPAAPATFTTPAMGMDVLVLDENSQPVNEPEMGEAFLVPPSIGLSQVLLNRDHEDVYYSHCPKGPHQEVLRCHGDQVQRLPGGFFRALGRADDTMNLGGIKVSSMELERVINAHPAVFESAAIAYQPGGEGAEKLVVYAILGEGGDLEELRRDLGRTIAQHLNPLFKIFDLVVVDSIPRTASNKLMRRKLRWDYAQSKAEGKGR